jgi:hypothetical protein
LDEQLCRRAVRARRVRSWGTDRPADRRGPASEEVRGGECNAFFLIPSGQPSDVVHPSTKDTKPRPADLMPPHNDTPAFKSPPLDVLIPREKPLNEASTTVENMNSAERSRAGKTTTSGDQTREPIANRKAIGTIIDTYSRSAAGKDDPR